MKKFVLRQVGCGWHFISVANVVFGKQSEVVIHDVIAMRTAMP
jgi:hypothetical protein